MTLRCCQCGTRCYWWWSAPWPSSPAPPPLPSSSLYLPACQTTRRTCLPGRTSLYDLTMITMITHLSLLPNLTIATLFTMLTILTVIIRQNNMYVCFSLLFVSAQVRDAFQFPIKTSIYKQRTSSLKVTN